MKQRIFAKKLTALCAAVMITVTSVGASFSVYAEHSADKTKPAAETSLPSKYDLRNVNGKNYVTPVKSQSPYSTCWAFAAAAAAETNYLYANDMGVPAGQVNDQIDISEKHTAWFAFQPITENDVTGNRIPASQVGEGLKVPDTYDAGGKAFVGVDTYARYGGPVEEKTVINGETPFVYAGKNKWVTNDPNRSKAQTEALKEIVYEAYVRFSMSMGLTDINVIKDLFEKSWADEKNGGRETLITMVEPNGPKAYAPYDDWSIPVNSEYRLANTLAEVKDYKMLQSPSERSDSNKDKVTFDQKHLDAAKKEIASGHAIIAYIYGDSGQQAESEDEDEDIADSGEQERIEAVKASAPSTTFVNTENWAQYVNKAVDADHAVTIVGYDDSYSRKSFIRKDANGNDDPTTVPPGDGAFIVKNSWGSVTEADKKNAKTDEDGNKIYDRVGAGEYGIDNSGYFYLSYYDQSITVFVSLDLYKKGEKHAENANQYDLMTSDAVYPVSVEGSKDTRMAANVFTAQADEYLSEISFYAAAEQCKAQYSIYKNFKGNDPTTGELVEKGTKSFDFAGYYRFALKNEHLLRKGDKYAVVIHQICIIDGFNKNKPLSVLPVPFSVLGATGIINKGESLVYLGGKWYDLKNELGQIKEECFKAMSSQTPKEEIKELLPNGADSVSIDNFAIRAFTSPAPVRLAGETRYGTAAEIAKASYEKAETVILAYGLNYADALAGIPLANKLGAPILLTGKDSLPKETTNAIEKLGAKNVIILGGTGAVSENVEKILKDNKLTTSRIEGKTRFATAAAIAENLDPKPQEVFFVYGLGFADALSASSAAAVRNAPIIYLSKDGELNADTKAYLEKIKGSVKNAYIIGGTSVISDDMASKAANALGLQSAERISGKNRFETCVAVNERFADDLKGTKLCVATGNDFPDALTGGVYAAKHRSPLLLVNSKTAKPALSDEQKAYLKQKAPTSITVFGGKSVVSDDYIPLIENK